MISSVGILCSRIGEKGSDQAHSNGERTPHGGDGDYRYARAEMIELRQEAVIAVRWADKIERRGEL